MLTAYLANKIVFLGSTLPTATGVVAKRDSHSAENIRPKSLETKNCTGWFSPLFITRIREISVFFYVKL